MNRLVLLTVLVACCVIAACVDESPVSAPGTLTVSLRGPHPAEGAAVLSLLGEGIGAVTALGDTEVHSRAAGEGGVRIVLLHPTGGALAFEVAVADTTTPPAWVVEEVAGPDDRLRSPMEEYVLDFSPPTISR